MSRLWHTHGHTCESRAVFYWGRIRNSESASKFWNPKVWPTYQLTNQPTYLLTWVGARDTCVSKNQDLRFKWLIFRGGWSARVCQSKTLIQKLNWNRFLNLLLFLPHFDLNLNDLRSGLNLFFRIQIAPLSANDKVVIYFFYLNVKSKEKQVTSDRPTIHSRGNWGLPLLRENVNKLQRGGEGIENPKMLT